jgi:hypothetical protein
MLVRLLIAVLMLTGPLPVRVCTCAAAARPSAPADQALPSLGPPAAESTGCGCRNKSNADSQADAAETPSGDHSAREAGGGHSHPDRQPHERNCPAVNPRPVVTAAVPSPAADAPTDHDLGLPLWVDPVGGCGARISSRPKRHQTLRSVPLYISLLTLRN